jgi:peptide/nickel transport system ATP-binding protein
MEKAPRRDIFYHNHHPYTQGLLASLPSQSSKRLTPIPGSPPSLINLGDGCPFAARCSHVFDRCRVETPPLADVSGDPRHQSACWLNHDVTEAVAS